MGNIDHFLPAYWEDGKSAPLDQEGHVTPERICSHAKTLIVEWRAITAATEASSGWNDTRLEGIGKAVASATNSLQHRCRLGAYGQPRGFFLA